MDLKLRKQILNLPKFSLGFTPTSLDDILLQAGSFNFEGQTQGVTSAADALKTDVMASNAAAKDLGGMPSSFTKAAPKGGVGGFLKNNATGIANTAMSALNFANTIAGASKNTMTSDEMMGSGGQFENNANGISYQESRVDSAGIQNQINATANAATMGGITSGAQFGGSIGSFAGPIGTAIGTVGGALVGGIAGFFGGRSAKREAERQKEIAINRTHAMNAQNRETAYTIGLRNEFDRENKTGLNQSLFHAALGKEGAVNPLTGATYKNYAVNTAHGKENAPQNAWVSVGEVIASKDGSIYKVPKSSLSKKKGENLPGYALGAGTYKNYKADTERAFLRDGDSVYSNRVINPETGNPVAEDAPVYAAMGMLDRLDMNLNVGRMLKYTGKRKGNLLPGYLGGTPGGFGQYRRYGAALAPELEDDYNPQIQTTTNAGTAPAPTTTGTETPGKNPFKKAINGVGKGLGALGTALGGLDFGNILTTANAFANAAQRDAKAEGIRAPKSYMANPYENMAIDELNKLQSDYYQVWAGNREAEGRAKNAIAQSGGLGAGLRMLAYMGMLNQTQQNNAKAMFDAQNMNNELRAQAAKIKLAAGENSANRMQQAYHWDEDMLAKAHAAQLNMWELSAFDRQNAIESFFHNRFKKNQFDRTMNLYESQQKNDNAKTQALIDSLNKPVQPAAAAPVVNNPAAVAPQTVKQLQKMWENKQPYYDLGDLDEVEITPQKKIKPRTKRRIVKKGGKK